MSVISNTQKPFNSPLLIQLEERSCLVCQKRFKSMSKSNQRFCGAVCKDTAYREPKKYMVESQVNQEAKFKSDRRKEFTEKGKEIIARVTETKKPNVKLSDPTVIDIEYYDKKWNSYVVEAKKVVSKMGADRLRIATLAIEACDIRHGGGGHWNNNEGVYTMKRFASEVGINYKTLANWVRVKRNVIDKLPEGAFKEDDWAAANRASDNVPAKASREDVEKSYKKWKNERDEVRYHTHANRKIKTILYFFKHSSHIEKLNVDQLKETLCISEELVKVLSEKLKGV